jgi:hypothetical protein
MALLLVTTLGTAGGGMVAVVSLVALVAGGGNLGGLGGGLGGLGGGLGGPGGFLSGGDLLPGGGLRAGGGAGRGALNTPGGVASCMNWTTTVTVTMASVLVSHQVLLLMPVTMPVALPPVLLAVLLVSRAVNAEAVVTALGALVVTMGGAVSLRVPVGGVTVGSATRSMHVALAVIMLELFICDLATRDR